MKKIELRIGNLVQTNKLACNENENTILKVDGFGLDVDFTNGTTQNYIGVDGILLNKDWLRKFGCKQGYWFIPVPNLKAELHFEFYGDEIVTTIKSQFSDLILDPIKYVHKLQNIFYALANKDLTVVDGF